MWVVPCHHTGGDMIDRCVAHILEHSDDPIVVVDSVSPDRSYMRRMPRSVVVADVANTGYAPGAFAWAYKHLDAPFWSLIHDSLLIHDNLDDLKAVPVTSVRRFPYPETGWGWDAGGVPLIMWGAVSLARVGLDIPDRFDGLFGPMLFAQDGVMADLDRLGLFDIVASDKFEACAMERVWGVALHAAGHDLRVSSLQGEMTDFFGSYPQHRVEKVHLDRQ